MRVSVVRGGGVAGMVVTHAVDTADLDAAAAAALRDLVAAATWTDRPASRRPDATRVQVDVAGEGGDAGPAPGRVRYDDGDAPEGVADLVAWVLDSPHTRRRVGR